MEYSKRQQARYKRKGKRIQKDKELINKGNFGFFTFNGFAELKPHNCGYKWECEMGYSDCNKRRWCNGDC
ncbi:MAG: hypothetical protein ACRCVU_11300 [Flavobacterium sp.]